MILWQIFLLPRPTWSSWTAEEGLIHPDPAEIDKLPMNVKQKTFLTHRSNLPEGITGLNLIRPGQQWEFIPASTVSIGDINAIGIHLLFPALVRNG